MRGVLGGCQTKLTLVAGLVLWSLWALAAHVSLT